jgi:hypothetical protein
MLATTYTNILSMPPVYGLEDLQPAAQQIKNNSDSL